MTTSSYYEATELVEEGPLGSIHIIGPGPYCHEYHYQRTTLEYLSEFFQESTCYFG
jgi:hypothetical protein